MCCCPGRRPAFRHWRSLLEINVSVTPPSSSSSSAQVEAKSRELGPSGDIPQIKTALDDVSHCKKTCDTKILTRSSLMHIVQVDENQTETLRLQVQDFGSRYWCFLLANDWETLSKSSGKGFTAKNQQNMISGAIGLWENRKISESIRVQVRILISHQCSLQVVGIS